MKEPIAYNQPAFLPWYKIKSFLDRDTDNDAIERKATDTNSVLFYVVICATYKIVGDNRPVVKVA